MRLNSDYDIKLFYNRRSKIEAKLTKATRNISSGLKVQSAADDPAGLAVSETTRAQIRGLAQSQRNIQDSMGLLKTAEDGIMKTNEDVQRLYELSVMASNDTMDDQSRAEAQVEVNQLLSSIQQTSATVQFNTHNLLGPDKKTINLQLGSGSGQTMKIVMMDISTDQLGLTNASVETKENANKLLETTKNVINKVAGYLTQIGSQYSSLEHILGNSLTLQNNLTKMESSIRDSDIGKETMNLAIDKMLSEANLTLHNYSEDQKKQYEKALFG